MYCPNEDPFENKKRGTINNKSMTTYKVGTVTAYKGRVVSVGLRT